MDDSVIADSDFGRVFQADFLDHATEIGSAHTEGARGVDAENLSGDSQAHTVDPYLSL